MPRPAFASLVLLVAALFSTLSSFSRAAVLPLGTPQERVLGVPTLLALYGPDLLNQLAGTIQAWYASALEGDPIPS